MFVNVVTIVSNDSNVFTCYTSVYTKQKMWLRLRQIEIDAKLRQICSLSLRRLSGYTYMEGL